jgi:hypothetical protein
MQMKPHHPKKSQKKPRRNPTHHFRPFHACQKEKQKMREERNVHDVTRLGYLLVKNTG